MQIYILFFIKPKYTSKKFTITHKIIIFLLLRINYNFLQVANLSINSYILERELLKKWIY